MSQLGIEGTEHIRTLGLYQPFATMMLHGKVETRWVRKYRRPPFPLGKYLIYSTQKKYKYPELCSISGVGFAEQIESINFNDVTGHMRGYAIAFGELKAVVDMTEEMEQQCFVRYAESEDYRLVALKFDLQRIVPFRFKGKQGVGKLHWTQHEKIKIISA